MPSLRRRLLLFISVTSIVLLALASTMSYRRARHDIQELMDDQLAKTAQLVLALAGQESGTLADLPQRLTGVRGLKPRRNQLTLEYQVGRADGTVLARSAQAPATPLTARLGYANLESGGERWRSLVLESADGLYRAQIAESIPNRDCEALEIAIKTVQPLALALPFALLGIYFSIRRGLKPLDDLASEVATRSSDNLAPIAGRRVPREAQPLVVAINRVLYRLGSSLDNERRFTADAAHELRTPLAAARVQAQVAMLSQEAGPRTHALSQTLAGLDRATRLVEQMLRLARLDPLARLPQTAPVDLAALVQRVVAGVQDAKPDTRIGQRLPDEGMIVEGDVDLLEVAVRNLLDNAVRYSPVGSEVTVLLVSDTGEPTLTVQDDGPGVPPEELPRLMERFYRGTAVTAEGSGLGLTIVGRIAELHGAVLELANRPSGGFEARLCWRG